MNLLKLLNNYLPLRILKVLVYFKGGLYVRELAGYSGLSPSTVSDTLKVLVGHGLIKKSRMGNKVFVTSTLSDAERQIISLLVEQEKKSSLEKSAQGLSKKAIDNLKWNAEMLEIILKAKMNAAA